MPVEKNKKIKKKDFDECLIGYVLFVLHFNLSLLLYYKYRVEIKINIILRDKLFSGNYISFFLVKKLAMLKVKFERFSPITSKLRI